MNRIEDMKKLLRSGNIVVSPRDSGKTESLVEIYHEDKDAAIVLPSEKEYRNFIDLYENKYGKAPDKRYIMLSGTEHHTVEELKSRKIYVDELYISKYTGIFHAAITSFPHKVVVLHQDSGAV